MIKTGKFATKEQLKQIADAYQLEYRSPIMATLPGGKVPMPKEDFKALANRFAKEAGLGGQSYAVCPDTLEFIEIAKEDDERNS